MEMMNMSMGKFLYIKRCFVNFGILFYGGGVKSIAMCCDLSNRGVFFFRFYRFGR